MPTFMCFPRLPCWLWGLTPPLCGVVTCHQDPFGHEALNTLLDVLESQRDDLVVVLAGYPKEMAGLLSTNPGLRSRFPTTLSFDDYNAQELRHIGVKMLEEVSCCWHGVHVRYRGLLLTHSLCLCCWCWCCVPHQEEYELAPSAEEAFTQLAVAAADQCTGNARSIRNLLQRVILNQSSRVAALPSSKRSIAVLKTIEGEDITSVHIDSSL